MNLGQIRSAVREELQEDMPGRWSDNQIKRYINDGLLEMASFSSGREKIESSISVGEDLIDFPIKLLSIRKVFWKKGNAFSSITISKKIFDGSASTGKPDCIYLEGTKIRLEPKPDASGSLIFYGIISPPSLQEDLDEPYFRNCSNVLINYAVWQAFKSDKDPTTLVWKSDYQESLYRWIAMELEANAQDGRIEDVYILEDLYRSENI